MSSYVSFECQRPPQAPSQEAEAWQAQEQEKYCRIGYRHRARHHRHRPSYKLFMVISSELVPTASVSNVGVAIHRTRDGIIKVGNSAKAPNIQLVTYCGIAKDNAVKSQDGGIESDIKIKSA